MGQKLYVKDIMTPDPVTVGPDDSVVYAAKIIFEKINEELSLNNKGKMVAIDMDSGDYFIGDSAINAYEEAIKKYPNKKFLFKRIGFSSAYVVGAL